MSELNEATKAMMITMLENCIAYKQKTLEEKIRELEANKLGVDYLKADIEKDVNQLKDLRS